MIEDIAALLTEPMVVSVLQRTFAIPDELSRTEILACLAPRLPSSETIRALADVLRVERDDWRATTLAALVPRLVELDADLQAIALSACVGALSALVRSDRTSLIQALAPFGEGRLLRQLLDAALAPNADTDADLAALAPHLDGAMIQHAFEKVLALEPADPRPAALTALSSSLSGALAEQALDAALQDEDEEDAAPVMAALAARVGEGSRRRILEARPAVWGIQHRSSISVAGRRAPGSRSQNEAHPRSDRAAAVSVWRRQGAEQSTLSRPSCPACLTARRSISRSYCHTSTT